MNPGGELCTPSGLRNPARRVPQLAPCLLGRFPRHRWPGTFIRLGTADPDLENGHILAVTAASHVGTPEARRTIMRRGGVRQPQPQSGWADRAGTVTFHP